jgi:hypothetical protein
MRLIYLLAILALPGVLVALPLDAVRSGKTDMVDLWSPKCATPIGLCFVQPMPVGSPCWCGNVGGNIIP